MALRTRQAVLGAVNEAWASTGVIAGSLSRLTERQTGIGRYKSLFSGQLEYGTQELQRINRQLMGVTTLVDVASEVSDPEMELTLLRLTGPRLQSSLLSATLLTVWIDYLNLADTLLQKDMSSVEHLFRRMIDVQQRLQPSMEALSSLEPDRIEATASAMPELMGQLAIEFHELIERSIEGRERVNQIIMVSQIFEMVTMASAMRLMMPRLPPAAPAVLGVGLTFGSNGVMMGTRIVVSAEWVERMRQLVQAGVIAAPVVSAAIRISAGQAMMSQGHQDLPKGLRDALGEGPEVRAMHETGRAGAGMADPPQHHVLPKEFREWFEKRGFTGSMSIDQFCVELEVARHQAIHGGGNWRLGRMWPGEWNQMIMAALREAETRVGRVLTQSEILGIVAEHMRLYNIPMNFSRWRGR